MKFATSFVKHLQDTPLLMSGDVARSARHYLLFAFSPISTRRWIASEGRDGCFPTPTGGPALYSSRLGL
jgi:hypothetical protein